MLVFRVVATGGLASADAARETLIRGPGAAAALRRGLAQRPPGPRRSPAKLARLGTRAARSDTMRIYLQTLNNFVQWCRLHRQD